MVEFWYFFQLWKVCVRAHAGLTVCVHRTRRRSESCPLRSGTTPPVSSHRSWHRSGRGEKQQKVTKASADLTRKQELWGTRVIFLLPALPLGLCCPKHWAAWDGDDMSVEDWRAVPCPSPPCPPQTLCPAPLSIRAAVPSPFKPQTCVIFTSSVIFILFTYFIAKPNSISSHASPLGLSHLFLMPFGEHFCPRYFLILYLDQCHSPPGLPASTC